MLRLKKIDKISTGMIKYQMPSNKLTEIDKSSIIVKIIDASIKLTEIDVLSNVIK